MSERPAFVVPLIHLRTLPQFERLRQHQLAAVARELEEVFLHRGAPLVLPAEPATAMHMIVDGYVDFDEGAGEVGPGAVVGFLETLTGVAPSRSARAASDVVALRLEVDGLRAVCEQSFAVLVALLEHVAARTAESLPALTATVSGDAARWPPAEELLLDRVGRALALHRSPIFPSEGADALAELSGLLTELRPAPGQALWSAGEIPSGFFLVCSGSVEIDGAEGGKRVVGLGGAPGLASSLANSPAKGGAVAGDAAILLHCGVDQLLDVMEDHFEMAFTLLGRMAANLLAAEVEAGQLP